MTKMVYKLAVAMLILIAMVIVPATAGSSSNEKIPVIIGFKGKPDAALVKAHGGDIKYQYNNIPAIAVSLPEEAINVLNNNPNIAYIEEDLKVYVSKKPSVIPDDPVIPDQPPQSLPWGIDRIEADEVPSTINGSGIRVAVIDTGIDYDHPDLNVAGGKSFVRYTSDYIDDAGHGTHVAGTIAAVNNTIGVIGVAPNVSLYSLKALDSSGSGYVTDINAAIEWAINNNIDVISMSIGGGYTISQEEECQAAYDAGIVIVAAAGNEASSVSYPAALSSVIAVSATDSADDIAYFSNYGPEVELAAPGVNILSTYLGGGYGQMQGTSMATPHVSGVVALLLSSNVSSGTGVDLDGDGEWDPKEVRYRLNATADDYMIPSGEEHNESYGYGIVDASAALDGLSLSDDDMGSTDSELVASDPYIDKDSQAGGKFVSATATVNVTYKGTTDPVPGATVSGKWIYDGISDSTMVKATTNYAGTAVFTSPVFTFKDDYQPTYFDFYVTSVTL